MLPTAWETFLQSGVVHSNEELLQMMQDTVDAALALRKINQTYYQIVISDLLRTWQNLEMIAYARKIENFPKWICFS